MVGFHKRGSVGWGVTLERPFGLVNCKLNIELNLCSFHRALSMRACSFHRALSRVSHWLFNIKPTAKAY